MNGRCSNGDGDYAFETTVELMKKAGCRMDFNSIIPGSGPNMQQTVQIAKNYAERIYGHHNVVQGYGDEPSAQWCIDARKYVEAFQKEKMGFVLAGKLQVFHTLTPYLTLYNMAESPEMENATDRWNKAEGDYVAWYAAQHVGSENPAYNRRQYGLTPYLAGFSAFCNYAHHYGSWNDRIDDAYKPMVFAYGSGNGVIDTL